MKTKVSSVVATVAVLVWVTNASANLDQIKNYKEAYPDAKPKCISCHVDEKPKKDDGQHELNAYGSKAKSLAEKDQSPTTDTYKNIGKIEDFKEEAPADAGK